MSTPFNGGTPPYSDFPFGTATPIGPPILTQPIPGDGGYYLLTQDWMQHLASFTPLALNTPHPQFSNYYLTKEGPHTDVSGGMVKWTREYSQIPASPFYEWETTNFTYPGVIEIAGLTTDINSTSRGPYAVTTLSRVRHDYFIVDSSGTYPGSYTDPGQIPAVRQTIFCTSGTLPSTSAKVGAVYAIASFVTPVNGATFGGNIYIETVPPSSTYQAMVADAGAHAWSATQTVENIIYDTSSNANYIPLSGTNAPTWGGRIVAEDSRLSRWRGDIYVRTYREVLAK